MEFGLIVVCGKDLQYYARACLLPNNTALSAVAVKKVQPPFLLGNAFFSKFAFLLLILTR